MSKLVEQIKNKEIIVFNDLIALIDKEYDYQNSAFKNGDIENSKDENQGSGKVFYFAKKCNLDKEQTLYCFGEHYQNVLANPDLDNHQNIRNFMVYGWDKLQFINN